MPPLPRQSTALPHKSPYERPSKPAQPPTKKALARYKTFVEPSNADQIRMRFESPTTHGIKQGVLPDNVCPFLGPVPDEAGRVPLIRVLDDEMVLAGNTSLLDVGAENNFFKKSDKIRRAAYLIYVTEHELTQDHLRSYAIPISMEDGPAKDEILKSVNDTIRRMQNDVGKFFLNGVKATREHFDKDEFDLAPPELLAEIWSFIFERAPLEITSHMLAGSAKFVQLDNIFYHPDQSEERRQWQRAFKALFVKGCNLVSETCPGDESCAGKAEKARWYEEWGNLPKRQEFAGNFQNFKFTNLPVCSVPTSSGLHRSPTTGTALGSCLAIAPEEE